MNRLLLIFFYVLTTNLCGQEYSTRPILNFNTNMVIRLDNDLRFREGNGYLPNYDFDRIQDLSGFWKFEIGDDPHWAQPDFNDSQWEEIRVPSSWEDEGFPGYDGYAWYRTYFEINREYKNRRIYLYLGYIDDVDEVYLNGHLIGFTGSFPPDVLMTDYILRRYLLPPEYLNFDGENVLAVRVYDHWLAGGIIRGKIGLYVIRDEFLPDINLAGHWKFKIGDQNDWKEREIDETDWEQILVPLFWEVQGHRDYDGFAWYRKKFILPASFKNEKLVLLLGIIDDLDETYLNGHLIGRTGIIKKDEIKINLGNYWRELRGYYLPSRYLRYDDENVIAVRVYDSRVKGGIYDGPVGIVTRERYRKWRQYTPNTFLKKLLELIFGG